jgi:uncharacterized beta-barrel protein YwiB (DUF1934 family)
MSKQRVRVRIESRQDEQDSVQALLGDLYLKGDHAYIRYEESAAELGKTITLLKVEPGQIRIIRQGDVESEQTFAPGEKRIGFYKTIQGRLELEMHTQELAANIVLGLGSVIWSYDLYVQGEHAGLYRIQLWIQEE